jgi:hypothetical protein
MKSVSKLKILLSVLLGLSVSGCPNKKVDAIATFFITGIVYDQHTKLPIKDCEVSFIDTGYDESRRKKQQKTLFGKSNDSGKIDINTNYRWGYTTGPFYTTQGEETFSLEFVKKGYTSQQLDFNGKELKDDCTTVEVNLGEIFLQRTEK